MNFPGYPNYYHPPIPTTSMGYPSQSIPPFYGPYNDRQLYPGVNQNWFPYPRFPPPHPAYPPFGSTMVDDHEYKCPKMEDDLNWGHHANFDLTVPDSVHASLLMPSSSGVSPQSDDSQDIKDIKPIVQKQSKDIRGDLREPPSATVIGYNQIQLYQFLLEVLMSPKNKQYICWTGDGLEFQLKDPDAVARWWGMRKGKPKMNYEKLSRSMRYYYDKRLLEKSPGKRYTYKFTADIYSQFGKTLEQFHQLIMTMV